MGDGAGPKHLQQQFFVPGGGHRGGAVVDRSNAHPGPRFGQAPVGNVAGQVIGRNVDHWVADGGGQERGGVLADQVRRQKTTVGAP